MTEPKPWEIAMAARRRDVRRDLKQNAARLRQEGDIELADQVERFARGMAPNMPVEIISTLGNSVSSSF